MSTIRVCHVTEAGGGVQKHLADLDKLMPQSISQHFVLSPLRNSYTNEHGNVLGVRMSRNIHPVNDFLSLIKLWRIIKTINPDIIHCHSSKAGALGRLIGAMYGVPTLYSPHGFAFHEYSSLVKNYFYASIERILGRCGTLVIASCPSEAVLALRNKIVQRDQITVVENGIDLSQYKGYTKTLDPENIKLLFIGRLVKQKNPSVLIDVVKILKRDFRISLDVIGDGELYGELSNQVKENGLSEDIKLLGYQVNFNKLVGDADIILMPSLWEGFPYSLIEVLALGRPVIGGDVTGIKDVIVDGYNGYLCNPLNPKFLADSTRLMIQTLRASPDSIYNNCIESVRKYDTTSMCMKLEKLYLSIMHDSLDYEGAVV